MEYRDYEVVTVTLERWECQKESYELGENLKGSFEWHGYSGNVVINLDKVSTIARNYTEQPVVTYKVNGKEFQDINSISRRVRELEGRIIELRKMWGSEEVVDDVLEKTLKILDRPL